MKPRRPQTNTLPSSPDDLGPIDEFAPQATPGGLGRLPILVRNTSWNAASQLLPQLTTFAVTPYLLHRIGVDRYAVWAFVAQILQVLVSLDGGLGASLMRFFAVDKATGDRTSATRLTLTASLVLVALSALATLVLIVAGPVIVDHFLHLPQAERSSALLVFDEAGALVAVALLQSVFTALLAAHQRYRALFAANVAGAAVYVVGVVTLVSRNGRAVDVLRSVLGQETTVTVVALVFCLSLLDWRSPTLMSWQQLRPVFAFSSKMQLAGIGGLLINNTDVFVIAALFPIRYVTYYSVAATVTTAFRALALLPVPPASVELASAYGLGGISRAVARFRRFNRPWQHFTIGYTAVGAVATSVGVRIWLGPEYSIAAVIAGILVLGHGVNLGTAMMSALTRAIGKPGIEMRYTAICAILNIALTPVLAVLFGIYGIEAATATALAAGSLWFYRTLGMAVPEHDLAARVPLRLLALAGLAAGLSAACQWAIFTTGITGPLAAAAAGAPAAALLGGYILIGRRVTAT